MYPLVRELAATDAPIRIPVAVTCRILGFSKQAFYHWLREPVSDRTWDEAHLINAAYDIHADDPAFGYRFIADELAEQGFTASERRVWRLCSQHKLWSMFAKDVVDAARPAHRSMTTTCSDSSPHHDQTSCGSRISPNTAQLGFQQSSQHLLEGVAVAGIQAGTGKLYLCAIKDVYSNRIVGYSIDSRMKASLAVSALRMSISRREPEGTVVHSDRGSQFRSKKFVRVLANNGLVGSMGRVGACGDNASMESFFSLLQNNVLDTRRWATQQELRIAIVTWIERTYHRRRRQRALGKLTPIEYEMIMTPANMLAA